MQNRIVSLPLSGDSSNTKETAIRLIKIGNPDSLRIADALLKYYWIDLPEISHLAERVNPPGFKTEEEINTIKLDIIAKIAQLPIA